MSLAGLAIGLIDVDDLRTDKRAAGRTSPISMRSKEPDIVDP